MRSLDEQDLYRVFRHFYEAGCRWVCRIWRLKNVALMTFITYDIELGIWYVSRKQHVVLCGVDAST